MNKCCRLPLNKTGVYRALKGFLTCGMVLYLPAVDSNHVTDGDDLWGVFTPIGSIELSNIKKMFLALCVNAHLYCI